MKNKLALFCVAVLLAVILVVAGCQPAPAPAPAPPAPAPTPVPAPEAPVMPKLLKIGTHEVGAGGYTTMSLVIEGMIKYYPGLTARCVPGGGETARAWMARLGDVHCSILAEFGTFMLQEGLYEFSDLKWGPQPVRFLWEPTYAGNNLTVRGDSGIKTFEDLRGRTVATFPGSPGLTRDSQCMLAFGGLTWDDVVPKEYPSAPQAYRAVIDGKCDCSSFNLASSMAYELEALPCGIHYLSMPTDDKEGWARLVEVVPTYSSRLQTRGAAISEDKPVVTMVEGYPVLVAWPHLDEDIAYWITRAVHESYAVYSELDERLKVDWTKELHWQLWDAGSVPLHAGAIRYFEEIGDWTPEREQMQQERLQHQEELKVAWDALVEEALVKGTKGGDIPDLWMEKRAEAGWWLG